MAEPLRIDSLGHITPDMRMLPEGYSAGRGLAILALGIGVAVGVSAKESQEEVPPTTPVPISVDGGLEYCPEQFCGQEANQLDK